MIDVSVIIPVYNVENYLKECLDSVCNQSLKNIEILCINDGSTDDSLAILEDYAKKDSRIKIINQENAGLGASRNKGLNNATGNYIYFIDSDDYIDTTALEKIYNNAKTNDSDLVLFKFLKVTNNKTSKKHSEFKIDKIFKNEDFSNFTFTYNDVKKHVLNSAFSACLKLYKKEFLHSSDDFYFTTGTAFEDVLFHVKVMLNASKISFVPEYLYYYRSNEKSITNTSMNAFDIVRVIDSVENYLIESDFYEEFEDEFQLFKISQLYNHTISSKSPEFYKLTKKEFESTNIDNNKIISRHYSKSFRILLESDNYDDLIKRINENKKSSSKRGKKSKASKVLNFLKKIID